MPAQSPLRPRRPPAFDLIETFRFELGVGFVRLDRHLARMERSAKALGFGFDRHVALAMLGPIGGEIAGSFTPTPNPFPLWGGVRGGGKVAIAHTPLRIRLALKPDGSFDLATQPYAPLPANAVWRIAIAKTCLSSTDPLIRHKTSRRGLYEDARAEFAREAADEVLLMNEHGELCEGTITTLFVPAADGSLLTPPLRCGLLAGVLRAELLEKGVARESVITPDFLRAAGRFLVGNSLRGLIAAELVSPV